MHLHPSIVQLRSTTVQSHLTFPLVDHVTTEPTGSSLVSDRTVDTPILREVFRQHCQKQQRGACTFQADGTVATSQMSPALAHGKLLVLHTAFRRCIGLQDVQTSKGLVSASDIVAFVPAGHRLEEGKSTSFGLEFPPDSGLPGSGPGALI